MLPRPENEILGSLGLKHALEDVLLVMRDPDQVSEDRRRKVSLGLAEYFNKALEGKVAASKHSLLLAPSEDAAVRRFAQIQKLFELKKRSDVDSDLRAVAQVLQNLSSNASINQVEEDYTKEILQLLLTVLHQSTLSGRAHQPDRLNWRR